MLLDRFGSNKQLCPANVPERKSGLAAPATWLLADLAAMRFDSQFL